MTRPTTASQIHWTLGVTTGGKHEQHLRVLRCVRADPFGDYSVVSVLALASLSLGHYKHPVESRAALR